MIKVQNKNGETVRTFKDPEVMYNSLTDESQKAIDKYFARGIIIGSVFTGCLFIIGLMIIYLLKF